MTLEQLAALGEIISSIAVVLSLIFVGFQVRESNRHAQAAAIQDALVSEIETSGHFATHFETWDKIISGQNIEGAELRKANQLLNILLTETENRYFQHRKGYLDEQIWEARLRTMKVTVNLPLYEHWRNSAAGSNHTADFLALLDKMHLDWMQQQES